MPSTAQRSAPDIPEPAIMRYLDRFVSPETRKSYYMVAYMFAMEYPYISVFLLLNFVFAIVPLTGLLLYTCVLLSILLFWLGVGLCVTLATLLITATFATISFVWILGIYLSARWFIGLFFDQNAGKKIAPSRKPDAGTPKSQARKLDLLDSFAAAKNERENMTLDKKENRYEGGLDSGSTPASKTESDEDDTYAAHAAVKTRDIEIPQNAEKVPIKEEEASEAERMKRDIAKSLK